MSHLISPLILAYHSISQDRSDNLSLHVDHFEDQLLWLKRQGYHSTTISKYLQSDKSRADKIVILTFDDGYLDNYTFVFPLLKKYGFCASFFLVADYVGTDRIFWWDKENAQQAGTDLPFQMMDWTHVQELIDSGMEIGSHTLSHPDLTGISQEQCWQEISASRAAIGARIGQPVQAFCYPYGSLNESVIKLIRQAGYQAGVVTPRRHIASRSEYTLRRVGIYSKTTSWRFRLKCTTLFRQNYERFQPAWQLSKKYLSK